MKLKKIYEEEFDKINKDEKLKNIYENKIKKKIFIKNKLNNIIFKIYEKNYLYFYFISYKLWIITNLLKVKSKFTIKYYAMVIRN